MHIQEVVKVLLVVIDAASPRVVCPAMQTGQLPVMQRLLQIGTLHESSTTIFPSITPAATASIITGEYPAGTGITGASWFDELEQQIAYYGDDFWVVAREGFGEFLRDFIVRLNGDRLKAPTLFELAEGAGRQAASLNYLVFRGLVEHKVHVPLLLSLLPGVPLTHSVRGPSVFTLGDFVTTHPLKRHPLEPDKDGLLHRFGMDDASTGELLEELFEEGPRPDLTVAYFADNDYRSHKIGPHKSLYVVERVDRMLGRAFEAAGGLERVLEDTCVIITSDHGHCEVLDDNERAAIHLHDVFESFRQATLGAPWRNDDEMMICPNMRAAQIYFHGSTSTRIREAIDIALREQRVDHVIWRTERTRALGRGYTIASRRGALEFWQGDDGPDTAADAFGTRWTWRGGLDVVDARVESNRLIWGDYPNAFERLAGVLEAPNSGTLWLTAIPGCEFELPGGEAHIGGASHGGLHALESYCPVLAAGPTRIELPNALRSIDIASLCCQLIGLKPRHAIGSGRAEAGALFTG